MGERNKTVDESTGWVRRGAAALQRAFNVREGRAAWPQIRKRFVGGSKLDGTHMCILIVAMLIASIGLNTDSTEAIVGAMLICPLMGSVLAISYAVATADMRLLRHAVAGLVLQMAICLATSTVYFLLTPIPYETSALLDNSTPTIWDLLIALAGGFAGGLGNSRKQEPSTLIAGVAVATALMPPLCSAGYGIAQQSLPRFAGALYEFGVNVVFIALAAEIVLLLLHVPLHRDVNDDGVVTPQESEEAVAISRHLRRSVIIGTLVFAIPCLMVTTGVVQETVQQHTKGTAATPSQTSDQYETAITTQELKAVQPEVERYSVGTEYSYATDSSQPTERIVATVNSSRTLSADEQGPRDGARACARPKCRRGPLCDRRRQSQRPVRK
ncbi:MAG: DUF389 domain-containing protein [Olsenella sp.]|nr:DUF389 domain-containing protein [Olsenella sp.]